MSLLASHKVLLHLQPLILHVGVLIIEAAVGHDIVQTCTGDPLGEANWHYADKAVKSSGTLEGLASGKVFVRVCARGADAHNGALSDLAEEIVR